MRDYCICAQIQATWLAPIPETISQLQGHLGIEALLLSGDASDSVLSAGRAAGLLVAAGIPARLLYALAEDCGALS